MATSSSFLTADEVVALAMSIMEGADTIDRAFQKQWVYEGLKEIGPNTAWMDTATLYPTEFSFQKPANMHSTIDLALYDSSDSELKYVFRGKGERIHESDNLYVNDGSYTPAFGAVIELSEDAHYFNISSNGAANDVSYAVLKYWKFPVDLNGDLLVPEDDSLALAMFIRYMYCMRKNDKHGINLSYPIWRQARKEARASHRIPSILEGTEIARTWTSMIQKQRFKQY